MTDDQFNEWTTLPAVHPFIFELSALRNKTALPHVLENFTVELAADLKFWENMYIQLRDKLEVALDDEAYEKR